MQLTSSVPAYSYHMVHVNVYDLFYFYLIMYTMNTVYISAIWKLLVNRNSLKTGRLGRSRDRPVYRESTVPVIVRSDAKWSDFIKYVIVGLIVGSDVLW